MAAVFEEVAGLLGLKHRSNQPTSPFELIDRIETGLPISALERVSHGLAPLDADFKYAIVPRATLARRRKQHARLSVDESDRLVRLAKTWIFARDVWGDDEQARGFLFRPHMMLEGRRPIDVARATEVGARLVEEILGRLKYGSAA